MKALIYLILPGILVLSLTSCSKYYINTVSSINMAKDNSTGEFQLENDSLKISFGFAGEDAPIHIKVHNKLTVPLFLDWTQSSMIYNGQAKAFIPDDIKFSGNISTNIWNDKILPSAESTLNGTIHNQKQISFIPPNSNVETIIKSFDPNIFKNLPDSLYRDRNFLSTTEGQVKVKVGNFDHSNSPLSFRTYLTFYTQDGPKNNIFSFDKQFYVSKSVKTFTNPQNVLDYSSRTADVFYNSKRTGYGNTMTGVGVAALVVGVAALQPEDNQK